MLLDNDSDLSTMSPPDTPVFLQDTTTHQHSAEAGLATTCGFDIGIISSLLSATALAAWFVGSLYLWPQSVLLKRDAPIQIKRRFASVGLVCVTAVIYLYFWARQPRDIWQVLEWMGVRMEGIVPAAILPLALTMMLFLGPLVMLYYNPPDWCQKGQAIPTFTASLTDLLWWRNYIVGPLTEEWVFRASICPLLICGGADMTLVVLFSPLFFGFAHLHHIIQHLHKTGKHLRKAWIGVLFQLFYTTVFGSYSAFLFVRTGHVLAPFLAHAFCNYMGFPNFDEIAPHPQRSVIIGAFVVGMLGFILLLFPLTYPWLYGSMYFS